MPLLAGVGDAEDPRRAVEQGGQRGQGEQVQELVQEASLHEGRWSRSKVLGAVRTKVW